MNELGVALNMIGCATSVKSPSAAIKAGDVDGARQLGEKHALAGHRRWLATLDESGVGCD